METLPTAEQYLIAIIEAADAGKRMEIVRLIREGSDNHPENQCLQVMDYMLDSHPDDWPYKTMVDMLDDLFV